MAKISSATFKPKVSQPGAGVGQSPLSEGLLNVKKKVITVDALTRHRIKRKEKQQAQLKKEQEKKRRTKAEDKLEKKPEKKDLKKKSLKLPGGGFLDNVKNFIGKIILGYFATRLIDHAPKLLGFLKGAAVATDFIIDWGGKIFDGLVFFLDESYKMYDGLKTNVEDLFGQEGVKQLEDFAESFKKVANYTLITAMAFGGFGEAAAEAQKAFIKKVARPAAAGVVKGIAKFVGKGAARVVLKGLKLASPVFKKIPIIGPLINFLISYFVFKEPIGKATLRAVGSAIFGALGAVAGSAVPFLGTAIGGLLGSVAGDYAGGWLYDAFFAGQQPITSGGEGTTERPSPTSTTPQGEVTGSPVSGNLQGSKEEKWAAIAAMARKAGAKYPNLVAAQFALESNWGTALSAPNNFFGIKATANEAATTSATQEVYGGVTVNTAGRFKNFATPQDAVNHLVTQWYKDYRGYTGVNRAGSAEEAAELLKRYSYATDPRYPGKLKRLLRQYKNVTIARPSPSSSGSTGSNIAVTSGSPKPASRGTKISGDLGRWLYKELNSPRDFQAVTEHPDFGGSFRRSYNSYHNYDRAIDIGAYPHEQPKILTAIKKFNRLNGVSPVELIHAGNDPKGDHDDHVHIAYRKGGIVPKDTYALLHKGEIIVDADSSRFRPIKSMLLAMNHASSYTGVLKAIADYAPYDEIYGPQVVVMQQSSGSQTYTMNNGGAVVGGASMGEQSSPMDILYKGS